MITSKYTSIINLIYKVDFYEPIQCNNSDTISKNILPSFFTTFAYNAFFELLKKFDLTFSLSSLNVLNLCLFINDMWLKIFLCINSYPSLISCLLCLYFRSIFFLRLFLLHKINFIKNLLFCFAFQLTRQDQYALNYY